MKTAQVTESVDDNGTEWGISLTDNNPTAENWFQVSSPEEALRVKNMLEKWANSSE